MRIRRNWVSLAGFKRSLIDGMVTVQTAKQSCELLLKIIDSILDYSKLEASALKLEPVPFLVEDVVADCVELLLPLVRNSHRLDFRSILSGRTQARSLI